MEQRLRDAVWEMGPGDDLSRVLAVLKDSLRELSIDFRACGVNIIDPKDQDTFASVNSLGQDGGWQVSPETGGAAIIRRIWQDGQTVYRPNLEALDAFDERELLARMFGHPVCSVVDVPFSHGTLAINCDRPYAFDSDDLAALEGLSAVLDEAFLRREDLLRLQQSQRRLEDEITERTLAEAELLQVQATLRQALEREQVMGRIRDRVLALTDLAAFSAVVADEWITDLRGLGIPVHRISLQRPSEGTDDYEVTWALLPMLESEEAAAGPETSWTPLRQTGTVQELAWSRLRYPWVHEAWETGRPVVVDRQRLEACGFCDDQVRTIAEIPMPGGGSLGVSSLREGAFDEIAVATLQTFAGLLATALERLHHLETLQRSEESVRLNLALQRVRNEVLQMAREEDWQRVVVAVQRELAGFVAFAECGVNLIDLGLDDPSNLVATRESVYHSGRGWRDRPALRTAIETGRPVYRRNRRDSLFSSRMAAEVNSVVDVPFHLGSLAVNSRKADAFSARDIEIMEQFAQPLSEAHRRLQDISLRRSLEREMVRIQRRSAAAELSAGVSHNLNNILTGVLLPAQILRSMTVDPAVRELADTILVSCQRATDLVHRLHLSVRGETDTAPRPIDLGLAIDRVIQVTRPRWKDDPEARGLTVKVTADLVETPPIRGTESGLHDLLTNLVLNAVDALPQGGTIAIRTRLDDGAVRLELSDDGIGMDEDTRLRIFEPFFTTKKGVGTGLGLSTLHSTVTQWGGRLEVDSVLGKGSTFRVWLPVWPGEAGAGVESVAAVAGRRGRMLVIDDEAAVCQVMARSLEADHQVATFTDPAEALAGVVPGRYEGAIVDLGMPGISGEQVARQLEKLDPAVVRVLFTGWELEERDPRRAAFDLELRKPLEGLTPLQTLVARALQLYDARCARERRG